MTQFATYVGADSAVVGSNNISAKTNPSGSVPGDLLILAVQSSNQSVSTPSGWTAVPSSQQGTGTGGAAGATRLALFYRWADKDTCTTGSTVVVLDTGDHTLGICVAFRGVSRESPFNADSGSTEANNDTTFADSGVTSTVDNCLIAVFIANSIDGQSTERLSSPANSNLGSVTNRTSAQIQVANGTGGGINLITGTLATAGSTGSTTATYANNSNYAFITLALGPALGPWLQAIGTLGGGTGGISGLHWPTHQTDDIGVLFVESYGDEPVPSTPSGWTKMTNTPQATGAGAGSTQITVYWRRATSSSEADVTIADVGTHQNAVILTFRGAGSSGDIIDAPTGSVKSSASTSVSITGTTTTYHHALVVYAATRATSTTSAQYSAWSNGTLVGGVEAYDQGGSVVGGGYGIFMGVLPTAGATGTTTATNASSTVEAYQVFGIIGLGSTLARHPGSSFAIW